MARKGIAVSQIILLVLGILVLAVVAYLLYTQFVTTGSTISKETCRAEATRACTGCAIAAAGAVPTCAYTSTNKILSTCYTQGNLLGTSTATTVDCTQYTGGGTGVITNPPPPPGGTTALACTEEKCKTIGTTWILNLGGATPSCKNTDPAAGGEVRACPA